MRETNTIGTYLMKKNGENWEKLIDILDYPALGGKPESIDVTNLSDRMQRFISGVQKLEALEFKCHYTEGGEAYKKLKELENQQLELAVWFGADGKQAPIGKDGKFSFNGTLAVAVNGNGVNEARTMTITITPNTEIKFEV